MIVGVVGLGKLGAATMAAMASRWFNVIGVDVDQNVVDAINSGKAPNKETDLQKYISENRDRLFATTDYSMLRKASIIFIIVPTPSASTGEYSMEYVSSAMRNIGEALKDSDKYHVVVITSTVLPGDTEKLVPLLEEASGKKVGEDIGVCYNPDFIALGSVIRGLLNPEVVLIGESDMRAGRVLEGFYNKLLSRNTMFGAEGYEFTPIHRMSIHSAELAKISLNFFVVMKINFANMITDICTEMPEGNAAMVLGAIGCDGRIGHSGMKPGLSPGGPCFPRDSRAFEHVAKKYTTRASIAEAVDEFNKYHTLKIVSYLIQILVHHKENEMAVLGLTYKPSTSITEESAALAIVRMLSNLSCKVFVYDPAGEDAYKDVPKEITTSRSVEECIANKRICFIATPWDEFKELSIDGMREKPIIIDAWGVVQHIDGRPVEDFDYLRLGQHHLYK